MWCERLRAFSGHERDLWPAFARAQDAPDARNGNASNLARHACTLRSREQQFVILAPMQSLFECCA